MMDIKHGIKNIKGNKDGIYYASGAGYWSNLARADNNQYLKDLNALGARETVNKHFPQHVEAIFALKRAGGIATLDFSQDDIVLDAGCMWGALSLPIARTGAEVIAFDQTEESLRLLKQRMDEEGLDNLHIVRGNLKEADFHHNVFTKVIVNGVLEWLPEDGDVEVCRFINRGGAVMGNIKKLFTAGERGASPVFEQQAFLKKICLSLKDEGCLYLAIENRFNIYYFLGLREEHCGIRFISLLPRKLQDTLSLILRGRRFRTWTYSMPALKRLFSAAGFSRVEMFFAFPDYKEPDLVLSDRGGLGLFRYNKSVGEIQLFKKAVLRIIEYIVFKRLRWTFFAPSFIVHAYKK
ncbi:MAG: class I SAM-dependent methyltransferase [Candidatus Omnitrophota bacterium]|jgi:hypothetical protein